MDAREEILRRIRRASADVTTTDPRTDVPVTWEYGRGIALDDPVGEFVAKVSDYRASVVRVDPKDVARTVVEEVRAAGASSVVVPSGLEASWREALVEADIDVRLDDPALSHAELDGTDAVVTAAASAIADTGTIVLTHASPDQGRRALTLVPDRHVCVIAASQVVSDVPQALAAVKDRVVAGSPLTLVSGGSATSDIELARVDGVHGPRVLRVIVVDDL